MSAAPSNIWAVARHTLAQCVRMKIAVAFIILLALALGLLPVTMKGDGTLAGQIRTFLSYSLSLTSLLVSLTAVLLSVVVITSDIRGKQIFTVATKPLARWQYVLGRWLGVVLLSAILLALAGTAVYLTAQHLRARPELNPSDRRAIEIEIFTARQTLPPRMPDIQGAIEQRLADLRKEGGFDQALAGYKERLGTQQAAEQALVEEIRRQVIQSRQSVGPGQSLTWTFADVQPAGQETHGTAQVQAVMPERLAVLLQADARLLGLLLPEAPVRIGPAGAGPDLPDRQAGRHVEARVAQVGMSQFLLSLSQVDMNRAESLLAKGDRVNVVIEPTIQIRYKLSAVGGPDFGDDKLDGIWYVRNPQSGYQGVLPRESAVNIASVLTVPSRLAQPGGRVEVTYMNLPDQRGAGRSILIAQEDIAVLYRVGGFEMNLVRGLLLILLQVMFLAAVGVFWSSFLSFPVSCLVVSAVLILGMARAFLDQSLTLREGPGSDSDALTFVGHYLHQGSKVLLANLGDTNPTDSLADGMLISWRTLGGAVAPEFGLRIAVILALACLIFRKRELARVQV